ncbi:OmpA family protein [Pelagibacterium mangrovi]|uniref:OmpA family protein n=1 Tax=Pelagibacterium mangrovi TaxID=3119828 RepID=UPI002FCA1947
MTARNLVALSLIVAALPLMSAPAQAQVQDLDIQQERKKPDQPKGEASVGGDIDSASLQVCREQLETFMTDRSILFASGSARIAAESEGDLGEVAEILTDCPATPVYIEGHTDADGRAETNLILSLSRAEAVVFELTQLGIDPERLYAVGYGASLPIASNDTAVGKAQNRRIVFSFEDAAGAE